MTRRSRTRKCTLMALALALSMPVAVADGAIGDNIPSVANAGAAAADLPWMDSSLTPETRANLLLDAMTLDQKLQQLTGARPRSCPSCRTAGARGM